MFDHYGMTNDEDVGIVEYLVIPEDQPFHDVENAFYDREVHVLVNKVKSGASSFGPKKRIKPTLHK